MPTVDEGPVAALPEYFWVLWQELYNEQELQKRRAAWKSPVLRAIRKVLWKSPKHIPPDEFCEWLVDRLEQAVRSDLMQKIEKGLPPDGWKATIQNLDAWLTQSAANAAEDLRRGHIPGYRAKVRYSIVHLAPQPGEQKGADLFDLLPAPRQTCSHELLRRFFREGLGSPIPEQWLGSPIPEQCLEHLKGCASCTGLLQHMDVKLHDILNSPSQMIDPRFVRLMNELGMLNCARQYLRQVRRSIVADLKRYEPLSRSDRKLQAGLVKLGAIDRNLESMKTLPVRCKRCPAIHRGTPVQTFAYILTDVWRLHLFLLAARSLPCKTVLSPSSYQSWLMHT